MCVLGRWVGSKSILAITCGSRVVGVGFGGCSSKSCRRVAEIPCLTLGPTSATSRPEPNCFLQCGNCQAHCRPVTFLDLQVPQVVLGQTQQQWLGGEVLCWKSHGGLPGELSLPHKNDSLPLIPPLFFRFLLRTHTHTY